MQNNNKFSICIGKNKITLHFRLLKNILKNIQLFTSFKHVSTAFVIIGSFLFMQYFLSWSARTIFFIIFAFCVWTQRLSVVFAITAGMCCLFVGMLLTIFYNKEILVQDLPELFSVWAYIFFSISVVGHIIEFHYNKKTRKGAHVQTQSMAVKQYHFMDIHKK